VVASAPAPRPIEEPAALFDADEAPLSAPPARPEPESVGSRFERDGAFIAPAAETPRAGAPGEPSPETLRRLQAAVSHPGDPSVRRPEPRAASPAHPAPHQAPPAPHAAPHQTPQASHPDPRQAPSGPENAPHGERGRFGINSLIGRMTGGHQAPAHPARGSEPSLHRGGEDPAEADRQREIPAFLRRQAN
jgi:cell division protein FtsZ